MNCFDQLIQSFRALHHTLCVYGKIYTVLAGFTASLTGVNEICGFLLRCESDVIVGVLLEYFSRGE